MPLVHIVSHRMSIHIHLQHPSIPFYKFQEPLKYTCKAIHSLRYDLAYWQDYSR